MTKNAVMLLCAIGMAGCYPTIPPQQDAVTYRALDTHPGCTTDGLSYTAASIPGYKCAAKEYAFPAGVTEDTSKPIVLLIHGNSSTPADFEKYPANSADALPMLSERLIAAGFKTYAVDLRIDKVDDPQGNLTTENAARNIDHGWSVPIAEHFIESVMKAYPSRKIVIVGFSLGTTIARDAVRKLYVESKRPFDRIQAMILTAGSNHGVSTYRALCGSNPTMRGRVACELGDRNAYGDGTPFLNLLNGPDGDYETPCADGNTAYGTAGVCGGNKVQYTTIVMRDVSQGTYQDEFVSEASAALKGADNQHLELTDNDLSGYFYNGLFKNHFGSVRSEAALKIIMNRLGVQ